jgi:hypothetical protein
MQTDLCCLASSEYVLNTRERAFLYAMLVIALQAYELLALGKKLLLLLLLLLLFFQTSVFFEHYRHSFNCNHVTAGDQAIEKRQL